MAGFPPRVLFGLEKRRLCGDLKGPSRTKRGYTRVREGLLAREWSDRIRGSGFKLKEGGVRLDTWRKLLRVVSHSHRLFRGIVAAPFLEIFKTKLDRA